MLGAQKVFVMNSGKWKAAGFVSIVLPEGALCGTSGRENVDYGIPND
jgi:hypothetical protein